MIARDRVCLSNIQSLDSRETNESPFGLNLVTLIDEDVSFHKGIHELLYIAEKKDVYFGINEVQVSMPKSESMLEVDIHLLMSSK